ncbi:hypothetical protein [Burkholderia catarinensis]|uniref:hypothetical protein n=1 Tax=Burkholderia catarinensis TaxID=1108140 RepID=UPI00091FA094|nr:hypothetical protein [Burkholderia catarinensis]KAG8153759.1 hypothetical protein BFF94_010860 [Burkholderia catarinensis]
MPSETAWPRRLSMQGFRFARNASSAIDGFIELNRGLNRGLNSGHIGFGSDERVELRKGRVPFERVPRA